MTDTDTDIRHAITAERRDLAAVLAELPGPAWDHPTLCVGWRVREVVAHMTMPFRYTAARFVVELVRSRGNFHAMADRCARRDAASLTAAALTASLRDNAGHPWKPPGGGFAGALTHDVVHGLDVTVALGIDRRVPEERMRMVLAGLDTRSARKHFGVDLDGVALHAEDMDWTVGAGEPLYGSAQDLTLVMCGRRLPAGHLRGRPAERFTDARTA